MKRSIIAAASVAAALLLLLALFVGYRSRLNVKPAAPPPESAEDAGEAHPSLLYGRIDTVDGAAYQGRLRWGGNQEAFWGDYFNGARKTNPWAALVPQERLPKEPRPITVFGLELARRDRPIDLARLFMARFGDIARIEPHGRDVRVTLKSGTAVDLDRFSASDFDDGVRVWDPGRGIIDLDSLRIRAIELLPAPHSSTIPNRLHGTVRAHNATFTGFLQWDREQCLGSDTLRGRAAGGEQTLPFDTVRSITRRPPQSSLVTLRDGRQIELSGTRETGEGHRGIYVDDPRYGRVLVSWEAFEQVDFTPAPAGPAYTDFPPGAPLTGAVTTFDGHCLAGRLVFDLDESETTETLDAPSRGIDYTIPFSLVASVLLPAPEERAAQPARLILRTGEQLQLDCAGDLGPRNAGLLVFTAANPNPRYIPWPAVAQIDLAPPPKP